MLYDDDDGGDLILIVAQTLMRTFDGLHKRLKVTQLGL